MSTPNAHGRELQACDIEIIERTSAANIAAGRGIVVPNEIRINGRPVLAPASNPVFVHGISINAGEFVQVTLTLFARVVHVSQEPDDSPAHDLDRWADDGGNHA